MIRIPLTPQTITQPCSTGLDADLLARIQGALGSAPMRAVRALLDPMGMKIEPTPIVHKYVSARHLRLMFPVKGGTIERGTVASIVCLYDCDSEETLYAHPMHAGPDVNPLLKHPDSPMASPKAQPGEDGNRATTRMIRHKEALWQRFLDDRKSLGSAAASMRWRKGFHWALNRLYFCTRCSSCRWGSPFFDGPDPHAPPKTPRRLISIDMPRLATANADVVATILASDIWKVEEDYAMRGGFAVSHDPRIIRNLGAGLSQLIFPTNAMLLQGGALVAISVVHSTSRSEAVFAHCLSFGPEPEIQFQLGDKALGLPQPGDPASQSRATYADWRKSAWMRFWIDELESGIAYASERWFRSFWAALESLFGGNDLTIPSASRRADQGVPFPTASRNGSTPPSTAPSVFATRELGSSPTVDTVGNIYDPAIPYETLQNTGSKCFAGHASPTGSPKLRAIELSTLMVNLGRRCNQACSHCHVDAGPHRTEEMSRDTVELILGVLRRHAIDTLDITGGAPEMNAHFRHLAREASSLCRRVIDRCNLTILFEPGHEDLAAFLAEHNIEIIASLPSYRADTVDRQRGRGTFEKSIAALRLLNELGYGEPGTGLVLNLVFNPAGTQLAPPQEELEDRFRGELCEKFGVVFSNLYAMNNMPVNRFKDHLLQNERVGPYMEDLVTSFNPATAGGFMCRSGVSVGWDGRLYDCDFNHAAGIELAEDLATHIRDFDFSVLRTRAINTRAHCFGCAAGFGSSCSGALASAARVAKSQTNGRSLAILSHSAFGSGQPS